MSCTTRPLHADTSLAERMALSHHTKANLARATRWSIQTGTATDTVLSATTSKNKNNKPERNYEISNKYGRHDENTIETPRLETTARTNRMEPSDPSGAALGPLLQLRGRHGGNRRTIRQNQNLRRMDKRMKAYDYLPEAHEHVKTLNHYHADYVKPYWAKGKKPVAVIGKHKFYKLK